MTSACRTVIIRALLVAIAAAAWLMTIGEGTTGDVLHIAAWVVAGVVIAWFVVPRKSALWKIRSISARSQSSTSKRTRSPAVTFLVVTMLPVMTTSPRSSARPREARWSASQTTTSRG